MNEKTQESPSKPKGFWKSLIEKLDARMKAGASQSSCCGGSKDKEKGSDKSSCCS
jgi:hypothetical protein